MTSIRKQLLNLFEDIDPDLRPVVKEVILLEQEFIHMEKPRGVMERLDVILDRVAKDVLNREGNHEN